MRKFTLSLTLLFLALFSNAQVNDADGWQAAKIPNHQLSELEGAADALGNYRKAQSAATALYFVGGGIMAAGAFMSENNPDGAGTVMLIGGVITLVGWVLDRGSIGKLKDVEQHLYNAAGNSYLPSSIESMGGKPKSQEEEEEEYQLPERID